MFVKELRKTPTKQRLLLLFKQNAVDESKMTPLIFVFYEEVEKTSVLIVPSGTFFLDFSA